MSLYCASRLFASRKSPSLLIRSAGGRELSEAYFFPGISISGPPLRWGRPFCNCDRVEKRLCSKSNTCIHIKRPISYHLSYHDFGHVWTNIKLTTSQFADKKTLVDVLLPDDMDIYLPSYPGSVSLVMVLKPALGALSFLSPPS